MNISYDNLFLFMFKNNITKSKLALETGVSRNTVNKMAQGEPVHLAVIIAICNKYGLKLEQVIQEK